MPTYIILDLFLIYILIHRGAKGVNVTDQSYVSIVIINTRADNIVFFSADPARRLPEVFISDLAYIYICTFT